MLVWYIVSFVLSSLSTGCLPCPDSSLTADPISGHLLCPASSLRPRPLSCPQRGWGQTDTRQRTTASHHSLSLPVSLPYVSLNNVSQNVQITHASTNWTMVMVVCVGNMLTMRIIDKYPKSQFRTAELSTSSYPQPEDSKLLSHSIPSTYSSNKDIETQLPT